MADEVLVAGLLLIVLFGYLVLAVLQICASPASAQALQPLKHRLLNFLASFVLFVNGVFALMHFANPTNGPLVSLTVVLRACVGIVYNLVALNFLIKTFNAIYQSKLKQEASPKELQAIFKIVTWFSIFVMIVCVVTAFVTSDQFWLELYSTWFVMFAGAMSFIIIFGLLDVIMKLKQMINSVKKMRESMLQSQQRKSNTQTRTSSQDNNKDLEKGKTDNNTTEQALNGENDNNDDDNGGVIKKKATDTYAIHESSQKSNDENKEDKQAKAPGMYEVLVATTSRLIKTMIATIIFFICCVLISILRVLELHSTPLYEQLYSTEEYVTYIIFVLLLLTIFVVWAWEPLDLNNKEKFTICYLCCIGGDAEIANLQKAEEDDSKVTKEGSEMELTHWDSRGGSDHHGGVELISFPLSRAESQHIPVKFVIFNIEVFFQDISLFYTLARNRKFRMEQVSYEQLTECLGTEKYCEKITKYLTEWSRNAALFVIHPYCTTSQLDAVLDKLDFLDFFRGDLSRFVTLQGQPKVDIDFRSRVIGKDSDYFNLLLDSSQVPSKARSISQSQTVGSAATNNTMAGSYLVGKSGTLHTQASDTNVLGKKEASSDQINKQDSLSPPGGLQQRGQSGSTSNDNNNNNNNNTSSSGKKKKTKHNRSLHLVILEFIKMFGLKNDEILYIDCTDAAIKNMQNINLCKTLKPHSHHAMQLQHHGNNKDKTRNKSNGGNSPHSGSGSGSNHGSNHDSGDEFEEEPEHWIMTQNIIDMIDSQVGESRFPMTNVDSETNNNDNNSNDMNNNNVDNDNNNTVHSNSDDNDINSNVNNDNYTD